MSNEINNNSPDVSVIIPVHNESGAIVTLIEEIEAALSGFGYEIIVVDDCSKDDTLEVLQNAKATHPNLKVFSHIKNAGQSRAIYSGLQFATAPLIGVLDGDGQNDPVDFPKMLRILTAPDAPKKLAMVQGMRLKRQDTKAKKYASKIANAVRQKLLNDGAVDSGCGIKIVRKEVFDTLPYFDHMHRYMAALVKQAGFETQFIEVHHRPRETGQSKYTNIGRLVAALTDLIGVIWLGTRRKNPEGVKEV